MKHIKHINEYNSDSDLERYQVWEIVSFRNQETKEIVDTVPESEIPNDHNRDHFKYEIYSVKRITDDEVFTLGDTIGTKYSDKPTGKIDWMFVSFEQLRIDIGRMGFPLTDDITKI